MNEPIAVEAQFARDGTVRPLAFTWRDQRFTVDSLGRQQVAGEERRFLVMTAEGKVYELAYVPASGQWYLRRAPSDFGGPSRRRHL